ncbi:ATP-dependent DNA helicase [Marinobacterium mangrovicola]|uniref:DNA excision repair protein ERCC-2 n=1 Tax=Marinobacterium mangrovicola TaxID=1476959 RepID=A0A4R1GPE8_9GAMM|nr:ATP-dependent DNA helicase [Marinobacterium mangrovicola]TCK09180.1 DNA excision repair protein ERCC-2 [Marinobacterium mangrovicola]
MKVAVRSLCELAARSGGLEYRYTPSPNADEGIRGHKTLQKRRGTDYEPEYLLEGECEGIQLRGRADGYQAGEPAPLLEEIKTHRGDLSRVGEGQQALHWAQLKVYGALLCNRDHLAEVRLRLVYYDVAKDLETPLDECWSAADLNGFLNDLCLRYRAWHQQEEEHRHSRDQALLALKFPYADFRPNQRHLSETVYKGVCTSRTLLMEAPTGIGKTLGVVFPSLAAMPRRELDRLFLLTARTTGRQLILDSLKLLNRDATLPLRILELTARDKACEHPDKACHGESCPLADGFFDRLPAARQAATELRWLDREAVQRLAAEHRICPYYLAQEMARWCDLVVGDVNHYFDQQALLHGLSRQNEWRVVPLIDEAHNLIDRARSMYSADLSQWLFKEAARNAPEALSKSFRGVQRAWRKLVDAHIDTESLPSQEPRRLQLTEVPTELNGSLLRLVGDLTEYMTDNPVEPELQRVLFDTIGFMKLAEQFGDHSLCTLTVSAGKAQGKRRRISASLALENLIPADFLKERFALAHSSVMFSATLNPGRYYQDLLGLPETSLWQTVASPFSSSQIDLHTLDISTRFRDRAASVAPICADIQTQYRAEPGNYLVYLSSFAYLEQISTRFTQQNPDIAIAVQHSGMSEEERLAFIERFRSERGLVGFAVLGGAFSEGIDLPGDALVGVFVATLGLPPNNEFQEQLAKQMQLRFGQGYAYTYLYPGIRKVIQAAGRLIRTPEDRGVIHLIDDRFRKPDIRALLPTWWFKN